MMDGSFHIHVHDLCLDVGTKLTATIHISAVNIIEVQVADKVRFAALRRFVLEVGWYCW